MCIWDGFFVSPSSKKTCRRSKTSQNLRAECCKHTLVPTLKHFKEFSVWFLEAEPDPLLQSATRGWSCCIRFTFKELYSSFSSFCMTCIPNLWVIRNNFWCSISTYKKTQRRLQGDSPFFSSRSADSRMSAWSLRKRLGNFAATRGARRSIWRGRTVKKEREKKQAQRHKDAHCALEFHQKGTNRKSSDMWKAPLIRGKHKGGQLAAFGKMAFRQKSLQDNKNTFMNA